MEFCYRPYIDPEFESLIERIYPPRVSVDNQTCQDCTLVKVDSVNKDGVLLEMVQVLTELDLVISKSYISSDGGWFMDVFHVTDQLGNKLTDENLIHYIQQVMCTTRRTVSQELQSFVNRRLILPLAATNYTIIEITTPDHPGIFSEVSAALCTLDCHITAAVTWTHRTRSASIFYIEDGLGDEPQMNPERLADVEQQLGNVIEAHHGIGERWSLSLANPSSSRPHPERRLHQLMYADMDYDSCHACNCNGVVNGKSCMRIHVSIEPCKEKGYSIVNVRSEDRPKLLFDTVCVLTDMQYVVFHAAISSRGSISEQEFFIRQKGGCTLDSDTERQKLTQCLVSAIERRVPCGLRLDVCMQNRKGLLSELARVFRENSLSISGVEIGIVGERAVGSFYVTDTSGNEVNPRVVDMVQKEIGSSSLAVNRSPAWTPKMTSKCSRGKMHEHSTCVSFGQIFWSQLEWLARNFGSIRS